MQKISETIPCTICGAMPIIEEISRNYWNATHHECLGEPGVSISNSLSADQSIIAWNKWQKRLARGEVAIVRVGMDRETFAD